MILTPIGARMPLCSITSLVWIGWSFGAEGELEIPAGVTYEFAGSYENQVRAQRS